MSRHALIIASSLLLMMPVVSHAQEYLWCFDADEILLELDPTSFSLTIEHRAAMYNCCPEPVLFAVETVPGLLEVTEIVLEEAPCDCICCFNYKVQVGPLNPGPWTVRFHWRDEEEGQWMVEEQLVVVPAHDGEGGPDILGQWFSNCLESSPVPDPVSEPLPWGALKSRYFSDAGN